MGLQKKGFKKCKNILDVITELEQLIKEDVEALIDENNKLQYSE